MKLAFYKGVRPGLAGYYNRLVRWWDCGPYSHVEVLFSDGVSASSSFADGGVRFKEIAYTCEKWDFIELPSRFVEADVRAWFVEHQGQPYDLLGNLGFLWRPLRGLSKAYFCSEAGCSALSFEEAWRFSPNLMYIILSNKKLI